MLIFLDHDCAIFPGNPSTVTKVLETLCQNKLLLALSVDKTVQELKQASPLTRPHLHPLCGRSPSHTKIKNIVLTPRKNLRSHLKEQSPQRDDHFSSSICISTSTVAFAFRSAAFWNRVFRTNSSETNKSPRGSQSHECRHNLLLRAYALLTQSFTTNNRRKGLAGSTGKKLDLAW